MNNNTRVDRIVCAVSFSPSSARVVEWAAAVAALYHAELRLLHVMAPAAAQTSSGESCGEHLLNRVMALARHLPGRPRISAAVTEGDVADEVVRHARLLHADLIAIGMHSRDGSVSPLIRSVVMRAPCPVLAADERCTPQLAAGSRRDGSAPALLCPVNFLPASLAAVDYAFELGRATDAQVTVLHVLPDDWDPARRTSAYPGTGIGVEHHCRQRLEIAVRDASGSPRNAVPVVRSGQPGVEIVRLAHTMPTDLVVMGIDNDRRSLRAFGATAACVMQFAHCPVVLVPPGVRSRTRARARGSTPATLAP